MFSIYTVNGRTFTGPMEQLRQVKAIAGTAGALNINEDSPELQDKIPDKTKQFSHYFTEHDTDSAAYQVSNDAINQYKGMLPQSNDREAIYHAYQIMSRSVITLSALDTISQALQKFKQHRFHMMPIMNQEQQLIAMLSRRELLETIIDNAAIPTANQRSLVDVFVNRDHPIITSDPVTEVRRIAAVLIEQKLDAIPIIDEAGLLRGIVSRTDILKCTTLNPPLSLWA